MYFTAITLRLDAAPATTPPEFELVRVTTAAEVEEFEAVSVRGFANEDATIGAGDDPPTDDPR